MHLLGHQSTWLGVRLHHARRRYEGRHPRLFLIDDGEFGEYKKTIYSSPSSCLQIACAVAINTANWISIAVSATATLRRAENTWPLISWVFAIFFCFSLIFLGIFFACYQTVTDLFSVFLYVACGIIILLCLFSVVSGGIVILTIKNIENADPKLLFRTAVQLALLSLFELLAAVAYVVLVRIRLKFSLGFCLILVFLVRLRCLALCTRRAG